MTKEEIKQICQIYDNLRAERNAATIAYNSDDVFWEHVLATYKLFQHPLPSNLDDAEFEYAQSLDENPANQEEDKMIYDAFKAGAEWMAKQGVSMEVVRGVPWRAVDAFIHDHDYMEDSIIQIRKK